MHKPEESFTTSLGLPATGGSDAHEVYEVGQYITRFSNPIKDEKDLINALRSGNYSPAAFREGKYPGPEDQALFYPQRGFALLEVH